MTRSISTRFPMTPKFRKILLIALALAFLVPLTSPRVRRMLFPPGEAAGKREDNRLPVTALVVRPGAARNAVHATGTVRANEEVELRSEISARVVEIRFREGSRVGRGELLLKLDDSELQAQRLKVVSQVKLAEDKERRRRLLLEKQNISPEDYEVTLNELRAVQAELQLMDARIAKTEIRAPFDGVIGLRSVSSGAYVTPATQIATLQNIRSVKVDFSVPEKYAPAIRTGQRIEFRVAGSDRLHTGEIYAVEPKVDTGTRNILLRATAPNAEGAIAPGGFAEVDLVLEDFADALMIPTPSLVPDMEGQKVFVARNGVVEVRRITTGIRTESDVQVLTGLGAGDTLLTSGILQVVPGMPVRLAEVR